MIELTYLNIYQRYKLTLLKILSIGCETLLGIALALRQNLNKKRVKSQPTRL